MKKLIGLMFCMIFLIATASAFEFDNTLRYEKNDMKVTIENFWGLPLFGSDLGSAELKSHKTINQVRNVEIGRTVIMWYETDFDNLYKDGLGKVIFTDVDTDARVVKDYDFVIWGEEIYQSPVYEEQCNTLNNGTEKCARVLTGTKDKTRYAWLDYNSTDIPKGVSLIGLRTDIAPLEKIDTIWTIAGKKISKHAVALGTFQFLGNEGDGDETIDYFFVDFNFSVPDSNRVLVAGIDGRSNGGLASVVTMFFGSIVGTHVGGGSEGNSKAEFWYAEVPTGINGTINVTWSRTQSRMGIGMWAVYTDNSTPFDFAVFNIADGIATLGVQENGVVFGAAHLGSGSPTTWTGVTEDYDDIVEQTSTGGMNGSFADANASFDVSVNRFVASNDIMVAASWGLAIIIPPPNVSIDFPLNITYNETLTQLNYTEDGTGVRCWNSIDGAVTNSTDVVAGVNFTLSSAIGNNTWIVFCNNSEGSVNSSNVTFFVNKGIGTTLISPANTTSFNTSSHNFIVNSTPTNTNLANVTLRIWRDNGTLFSSNFTSLSGSVEVQTNFAQTLDDDIYLWGAETCAEEVACNVTSNRTFQVHTVPPSITIFDPSGTIGSFVIGDNLTLNWSVSELGQNVTSHIINCSFIYNGGETFLNNTICTELNQTSFLYVNGVNTLNFTVTDEFNLTTTDTTTWDFDFLETGVDFNGNVSETSNESFELNLTTTLTVLSFSAILTYNGTNHSSTASCSGGDCTVSNLIDIPLVPAGETALFDFFWTLTIFNGTDSSSITTSTREQNVTRLHLQQCDGTFQVEALNFTAYDEQTLDRLSPFVFDGTFDFWTGSGTVKRDNSISDIDVNVTLCLSPVNETFRVDAIIDYDEHTNFTNYTNRFYYFDEKIVNNVSEDIFMYLLKSSVSTSFILKVQDESLLPVANALIEIHRFYPGTGEFRIVQIAKTDDNGKSIGFFQTETVDYKFIIKKNGETLLETGQQKVIPETSPFTLIFNIGDPLGAPWESQEDIVSLNSSLTWNDTSGVVTYVYIDSSGNFTRSRLFVVQQSLTNSSADTTICNETSTLTSATLTCTVGSTNGVYTASAFITRDAEELLDRQFQFQIETLSGVVGLLGLFFGWFLILIAAFMFKFNEIAGIWAITITILLVNLTGLISFGGVFVTAVIALAIIITWIMEK